MSIGSKIDNGLKFVAIQYVGLVALLYELGFFIVRKTWKPGSKIILALSTLGLISEFYCPAYMELRSDIQALANPPSKDALMLSSWENFADMYASAHHRNKCLVRAVIFQESKNCTQLVSKAGALGCMQITRDTGKGLGLKNDNERLDPEMNIAKGIDYLFSLIDQHGVFKGLQAYNAGITRIGMTAESRNYPHEVLSLWSQCLDEVKVGLPLETTRVNRAKRSTIEATNKAPYSGSLEGDLDTEALNNVIRHQKRG